MYCNAACKKRHRSKHKKDCERRVAELHDEKLFKQPPPLEGDCPICFLRLPSLGSGRTYMMCCGKIICSGCVHAFQSRITSKKEDLCPFCRTPPASTDEKIIKRYEKRIKLNDARAIYNLGGFYSEGRYGLRQNNAKALEVWHRGAKLGSADAYYSIGNAYSRGIGVEMNEKKATHYYELAAMGGDPYARFKLGVEEAKSRNVDKAFKHFMMAVKDGNSASLAVIKEMYKSGLATKDDYAEALRAYQAYLNEIKSDQRDEAASNTNGKYRYYESAS